MTLGRLLGVFVVDMTTSRHTTTATRPQCLHRLLAQTFKTLIRRARRTLWHIILACAGCNLPVPAVQLLMLGGLVLLEVEAQLHVVLQELLATDLALGGGTRPALAESL